MLFFLDYFEIIEKIIVVNRDTAYTEFFLEFILNN
jgi:hypothetical protein